MSDHYNKHSGNENEDNEDDIFAELEAELENDENAAVRESGLKELQKQ